MIELFPALSHLLQVQEAARKQPSPVLASPAAALMESANDVAGQDPEAARALRSAAMAWLSIVR